MLWRETGSIRLHAPRERVQHVLARWMETDPHARLVAPDRFESADEARRVSTFILREEGDATRVIHAKSAPMALGRGRPPLREEVEAELAQVERLVQAYAGP